MEVKESPINEIIVHQVYKLDLKNLIVKRVRPDGRPVYLNWCDGILYFYGVLDDAELFDSEFMKGKFHFTEVFYTTMEEYKPIIEINTDQFGGLKVSVIDQSDLQMHKELAKWLKGRKDQGKGK